MYSVKPWSKACIVGNTIGSFATGVGMRFRETFTEVVESRPDPLYEVSLHRRCVIPQNTIRMLVDLGFSKRVILGIMRPAGKSKFLGPDLATLREVEAYTGCSPSEPVFHCSEGELLRTLRREYQRFGGAIQWGCEAYNAIASTEDVLKWTLHKDYGPSTDSSLILSYAKKHEVFRRQVVVPDPESIEILFDERSGICTSPSQDLVNVFGKDFDVCIVVGNGVAIHMWRCMQMTLRQQQPTAIAWRCIAKGRSDSVAAISQLHPLLVSLVSNSVAKSLHIPATTPAIRDEANYQNISICGDSILPVDPFEWRGDAARNAIEESSAVIRALYSNKFHRGNIPSQLRELEQDAIVRRANLLKRDLVDAEHFLAVHPTLPRGDEDDEPALLKRIGDA